MHSRCVLSRLNAIKDVLIEFCREIASKTVNFLSLLLHNKYFRVVAAKILVFSLGKLCKFLLVRIRQVSERKYVLRVLTAWVGGRKDFHHVRQLEWIELLRKGYTT